jgi:hypothetical protein
MAPAFVRRARPPRIMYGKARLARSRGRRLKPFRVSALGVLAAQFGG